MLVHASCVAFEGKGILLSGPPGSGKSDLALRLIDAGAQLVSDDQTLLQRDKAQLLASPPQAIEGMIEIRHVGLIKMPFISSVPVMLAVGLVTNNDMLERLPEKDLVFFLDHPVQQLRLLAFAASTPAKIRAALTHLNIL